jgi:hypothetical protein
MEEGRKITEGRVREDRWRGTGREGNVECGQGKEIKEGKVVE